MNDITRMKKDSPVPKKQRKVGMKLAYKISISGAAETGHCSRDAVRKAEDIGKEVAHRNLILLTGATTGIPYWAAKGAHNEGGMVIGFSPAESRVAHVKTYQLPTDYHDTIIFTGANYVGRNLILTNAGDGMVLVCGRTGSLNEFTINFENQKPIGVLEGTGGTADMIREILEKSYQGFRKVVFSRDPSDLLDKLIAIIEKEEERKHESKGRVL
ncbi:MAG: hypothetical protein Q7R98_01445 [Candidatus Jorgensenbacteria bacterium]|nr:hypothetical protein [Candidatus Jorgensenbacteria bacterium]